METTGDLLLQRADSICTLVINRPAKRNTLTPDCLGRLRGAFEELSQQDRVRVVVIRGAGTQVFSAGYDIFALPTGSADQAGASHVGPSPLELTLEAMEGFPFPVIAMLNGDAYGGGCELAMACDIRIAARSIRMAMPPAKLGLVYPCSGYLRFLRVLGFSRTLELFLSGQSYDSDACLDMGLVNRVVRDDELERITYDLAKGIASHAPLSLKGTKKSLYQLTAPRVSQQLVEEIDALFVQSLNSEDLKEAQRAFGEKRPPRFRGR